jgi:hypothetical protein
MSDYSGKQDTSIFSSLLRIILPLLCVVALVVVVLVDFSALFERISRFTFFDRPQERRIEPQNRDKKDFVFSKEDLEKASKELFEEQRKNLEEKSVEEQKVAPVYLIELISGKSLLADRVEMGEGVVVLYDKRSTITVSRKEIVSIQKKSK